MKKTILLITLLTLLLLPTINAYSWIMPPYTVIQVVDMENNIGWSIFADFTNPDWWIEDTDWDGTPDYFQVFTTAYSFDGEYVGNAFVVVSLLSKYVYIEIYVDTDAGPLMFIYYTELQYIYYLTPEMAAFAGTFPSGGIVPPISVSGFSYLASMLLP